jgi:hypothetical protein
MMTLNMLQLGCRRNVARQPNSFFLFNMFYPGSLREGISAALAANKAVVCFVTDDQAESALWERDYLQDPLVFNT